MSLDHVNGATKKELLSLPERDWQMHQNYDSLLILPLGQKHDSGWGAMAVIGCFGMKPFEIASGFADDLDWIVKAEGLHMDCAMPSRATHFWCDKARMFMVGAAMSTTRIWFGAK